MTARPGSGRVVDAAGRPVPGARVTIVDSPSPMPEMAILADGEGRFSLFLPPGRFVLRADGAEGEAGEAVVVDRQREVTVAVALRRDQDGATFKSSP